MGMRAVYEVSERQPPCIVRWTGRSGLSVRVKTYCGNEHSVGTDGVLQVPDEIPACSACERVVKTIIERKKAPSES